VARARRSSAQNVSYAESKVARVKLEAVASEAACESEEAALKATALGAEAGKRRRLLNFQVVDAQGQSAPVQHVNLAGSGDLFLTGRGCRARVRVKKRGGAVDRA